MGAQSEEQKLTQGERRSTILDYLRKNGPADGPSLRAALGLSVGEFGRVAEFLREAGELVMTGVKRSARWHLPGQKVDLATPTRAALGTRRLEKPNGHAKANGHKALAPPDARTVGADPIALLEQRRDELALEQERIDRAIAVLRGDA